MDPVVIPLLTDPKLWFSVFAVLVIFAAACLGIHWAAMAGLFPTLVGGVLGVTGAYLTGNVAHHWVNADKADPKPE